MSSQVDTFITRWQKSGAAERSNYALFLSELCDLLDVPRPDPSSEQNEENDYVIDRAFTRSDKDGSTSTVYLDLYKRGHFVLETKQGSTGTGGKVGHGKRGTKGWDKALDRAYHQARAYIRDLPSDHGRPPFLIVADVGHCIDLYAEFTGTGGTYLAFPNPAKRRIYLEDLRNEETLNLLRTIWTDPASLDPSKHAAKVTREVADTLAKLAASLEKSGHDPQVIAIFLQRLLFTLFAEDVGLLPEKSFEQLLEIAVENPAGFSSLITGLWQDMAKGTDFSAAIRAKVIHFNGGLFENPSTLPLNQEQIQLLLDAAKQDWKEVEPAIFGTLLERALDPRERHKLGAHYTPRSYVERLIDPTLMNPLREQWNAVKAAAALLHDQDQDKKAREEIEKFHAHLCDIKVLDPACGSGNFLYVALAKLKELEAEVLDLLEELGGDRTLEMSQVKVRPDQFLGIEINSRAAAIAQLVLWIGYFQWHHRTTGKADTNDRPLLQSQNTIENRDAVLAYDEKVPRKDPETGEFLTIWDGRTTKTSPVTGKEVADDTARKPLFDYINPRRTEWPKADYIVGNPPFLGASRMRDGLGDGYVEALRLAWKKFKPNSWDFVMFWWHQAAETVRDKKAKSFGFITTNSIHQTFNRRCLEPFLANDKKPISITFAIPDHPWVDSTDGAAVRIAMTCAEAGNKEGQLSKLTAEREMGRGEHAVSLERDNGNIAANLKLGANLNAATALNSNLKLSNRGVQVIGAGFIIGPETESVLDPDGSASRQGIVRNYLNGKDLTGRPRGVRVIDFYGYSEVNAAKSAPGCFQHIYTNVKPSRDQNNRDSYRLKWWIHGEPRSELRKALVGLARYIATVETSKHRFFTFLDESILPDNMLVSIASQEAADLSILSSGIHVCWALALGGRLGMGNDPRYNKTRCFETFPFPDITNKADLEERLRTLGEQLDSHRKTRQAEHPDLTLTWMYNVLEKLRKEEPLTDKEKVIHDQGLVTLLKQIHDDIDAAVIEAYGARLSDAVSGQPDSDALDSNAFNAGLQSHPPHLPIADRLARGDEALEQAILQFLVDLNHERAAEEAAGKIRYLRPDFQDPEGTQKAETAKLDLPEEKLTETKVLATKRKWPKALPDQVTALQPLITELGPDPDLLSKAFGRQSKKRQTEITQIIETLQALGQLS